MKTQEEKRAFWRKAAKKRQSERTLYMREYRERNRERLREQDRERYAKDSGPKLAHNKAWRARNPENRRRRTLGKYGLTVEQFNELFERQRGGCSLCGMPIVRESHRADSAQVDHCHKTGKVRGLLCTSCNLTLGHVEKGWNLEAFSRNVRRYLVDPQG
jgi:hypothetical protein